MASPGGVDAELTVGVDVEADAAARELNTKLGAAIAAALRNPKVQAAALAFSKNLIEGLTKVDKSGKSTWDKMTKAGVKSAQTIAKEFGKVATAAAKAASTPTKNPSLHTLETQIAAVTRSMESLELSTKQTLAMLTELGRQERAATRARAQEARDEVLASTQATRAQIVASQERQALARVAGNTEVATIRATSREAIQSSRAMVRVFELTWKSAERAVRAFARGASSILRGLVSTVSSVFRGISRTIQSAFKASGNIMSGFVRAVTRGMQLASRAIQAALRRDENAISSSFRRREQAASRSAQRQARAGLGGLGLGGLGGGLVAGGGIGALLTSGFERAGLRERLQLQFTALLEGDAQRATEVLQGLSEYARQTAFDFDEVALSVAQLTSAFSGNVERGEELTRFLSDVVSLTGGTTAQFSAARLAFTQIAATGRLEGNELNQLFESLSGAPLVKILADRFFGGDTAAFQDARRNGELGGKITSDAFFEAFQEGMAAEFPGFEGFALTAAETLTGRLANLKESFAEFGATLIGLVDGPIKSFFAALTEGMEKVGGFISGSIFDPQARDAPLNPFANQANQEARGGPMVPIPFEELTPEMQEALRTGFGWEEGKGYFLSAIDAAKLWNDLNAETEGTNLFGLSDENLAQLAKFREMLLDFAKGAAIVAGLAGAFKLLGLALRLFTSPLSLMLIAAGGLGVVFGQIYRASEPLRDSISALREQLGPLFDSLRGLGGVLVDKFFGLFADGDTQAGMQRVGDFLSGIVDSITRGAEKLTGWINWASLMIASGDVGAVFSDINTRIAEFLGGLLDISPEEIEAEGGGIAGLLRNTFLEPIVNFFTDTLPTEGAEAISAIGGFFADIWHAFTGEGGGGTSENGHAVFSGSGRVTSGGDTGMLSFLTDTFLDPVVNFFTETLPSAVRAAVRGIGNLWTEVMNTLFGSPSEAELTASVITNAGRSQGNADYGLLTPLWNSLTNFKNNVETLGLGEAFGAVWDGVVESAQNIWDGGGDKTGGGIKGALTDLWNNITGWFADLDWGKAISGAAIAAAIGVAVAGLPGLLLGIAAGAFAGDLGLFDPVLEAINGAWEGSLRPALFDVWQSVVGWFKDTFTADNLLDWGVEFLSFVNGIGEAIGAAFETDGAGTIAVAAAAGIAAAVAAIVVAFGEGLVIGLAGAVLDWSTTIGQWIGDAFELAANTATDYIPGAEAVVAGITDALDSTIGATAILAGVALGPKIITGLIAGVKLFGPNLVAGAGGLLGMLMGRGRTGVGAGSNALWLGAGAVKPPTSIFARLGSIMAGALIGGFLSFEFGRAAGRAGGPGGILLSLLSGTGMGAALGFKFGNVPGAVIGGGIGLAISALGVVFGDSEDRAARFKEQIQELTTVLRDLPEDQRPQAFAEAMRDNLLDLATIDTTAFNQWGADLIDLGFDFSGFARDVVAGTAEADVAVSEFVGSLRDKLVTGLGEGFVAPGGATGFIDNFIQQLNAAAADPDLDFTNTEQLFEETFARMEQAGQGLGAVGSDLEAVEIALDSVGLTTEDLTNIMSFAQGQIRVYGGSINFLGQEAAIAATEIDTLEEGASALNNILGQDLSTGQTLEQLRELFTGIGDSLTTTQKIQLIEDAAAEAEAALEDAKTALADFLTSQEVVSQPQTFEETAARARFELDPVALAEQFQANIDQAAAGGFRTQFDVEMLATSESTSNFRDTLNGIINDAVMTGTITTPAQYNDFINRLTGDITAAMESGAMPEELGNSFIGILNDMTLSPEEIEAGQTIFDVLGQQLSDSEAIAAFQTEVTNGLSTPMQTGFTDAAGKIDVAPGLKLAMDPERTRPIFEESAAASAGFYQSALQTAMSTGMNTSELTASVITNAGRSQGDAETTGGGVGGSFVSGISGASSDAEGAASDLVDGVLDEFRDAAPAAGLYGAAAGRQFAQGLGAAGQQAINNARFIATGAANSMNVSGQMFQQGVNAGRGFASGILSRVGEVVGAAVLLAVSAIQAVRNVLQSSSPSKVFINIGKDIGRGFIQGIKDSEGDMAAAISSAIEGAVSAGVKAAGVAVQRAQAAGEIFRLLQPSLLPGGTTDTERLQQTLSTRLSTFDFRPGLQGGAADALGEQGNVALRQALDQVQFLGRNVASSLIDVTAAFREAGAHKKEIADYNARLKQINAQYKSGALGQAEYNRRLKEMREQVRTGAMSTDSFNDQLKVLKKELQFGILNREAREAALSELGSRPEPLSYEEQQLLRTGPRTLDARFAQGVENREMVLDSLDTIRQWGQEALASGSSLASVIPQMQRYRDSLVRQLQAFGFNTAQINALVQAAGLSNTALEEMRQRLTSLNQATADGANNVANFLEQFTSIREFGQRMLESGVAASTVVAQMKAFRDQIINSAVAFGFNRDQIMTLVTAMGLSNAQLTEFVNQLNNFNNEARDAEAVAAEAARAARERALEESNAVVNRPTVEELHVHVPYGDPEAVALSTWNRFTYGSMAPA